MDAFFAISKAAGLVLSPSNLLVILIVAGGMIWRFAPRIRQWGQRILVGAASALAALALLPIGDWLLVGLERRFPPIEDCLAAQDLEPAGIVLLGGGLGSHRMNGRVIDEMNDGSDRLRMAATLARRYAGAPIVVSGGQAFDNGSERSEADAMADLLVELGVAPERIVRESNSRTTAENAALAGLPSGGRRWLLVTSAFHMPRAMGTFRKAGHSVIAAPTDWRVSDGKSLFLTNAADNLGKLDLAAKEIMGLAGYWATGRSSSLLPGPEDECDLPAA
jgi:uncharacterized SAM-binding protein YcdF (DUF218 family)